MKHRGVLDPVYGAVLLCENRHRHVTCAPVYDSLCSNEWGLFVL
jgi:hypothetical protein